MNRNLRPRSALNPHRAAMANLSRLSPEFRDPRPHRCTCGYSADSVDDLDDHILAAISGTDDPRAEPEHKETR